MKALVWIHLVRRDYCILTIINDCSTKIPWKVDYIFAAVVLKLKKCPKSGYWITVHLFQSCTMKASVWIHLVRRDYCIHVYWLLWRSTKITWKVDYLFTAVVLKVKMCLNSGYWISVHQFAIMNHCSTKITWKVDYLFTAVVLKVKMCLNSGYWISVHQFESCTMKASVWIHLVRRDFGMLGILNESRT